MRVAPPRPPLDRTPTVAAREARLADGSVVERNDLPSLARWTSLKMTIGLERYPFEWAEDRERRVGAVRELVTKLAAAAKWTVLQVAIAARTLPPKKPFAKKAFDDAVKKVALQRFNSNAPMPIVLARTGRDEDLQYAWSFAVCDCHLYMFAHDTAKNRATMDKLFSIARRAHDAAVWATISHGYAGSFSSAAFDLGTKWGLRPAFHDHDEAQLTPPWRAHIGRAWLDVPGTERFMMGFAKKQRRATIDRDGLLLDVSPPREATDRGAARLSTWRTFTTMQKHVARVANNVFHDPQMRKAMREKPTRARRSRDGRQVRAT
jgi:hypothetical protein